MGSHSLYLWKRKSHKRRAMVSQRRMVCEALEDRSLLAIAAFTVNLYEDAGTGPGQLISDDTIQAGSSFYLEVLAREFDPLVAGLRGVALDIAWDPAVFQEINDSFEPENPASLLVTQDFPLFRSGQLDNSAGTIDNLAGYAFLSGGSGRAIGNLTAERFSLLHFRALQPAEDSQLSMRQGRSSIVTVPVFGLDDADLYFEPQSITVVAATGELLPEQPPDSDDIRTDFVGPLTADEYFKSIHSELTADGEPAASDTIVVQECWSNEPVVPASIVDPNAAEVPHTDLPFTDESVHARASMNLPSVTRRLTDVTPLDLPSIVKTESDPSIAAVDLVFAADGSVELFDDVERRLKQIADGWFSSL